MRQLITIQTNDLDYTISVTRCSLQLLFGRRVSLLSDGEQSHSLTKCGRNSIRISEHVRYKDVLSSIANTSTVDGNGISMSGIIHQITILDAAIRSCRATKRSAEVPRELTYTFQCTYVTDAVERYVL